FHNIDISPIQLTLEFYVETSVMAMRNKIAKLLNIHPFSFMILKMDSIGDLDALIHSGLPLKQHDARYYHRNQLPFFCFQIDPEIFYNQENNNFEDLDVNMVRNYENTFEEMDKTKDEKKILFSEDCVE